MPEDVEKRASNQHEIAGGGGKGKAGKGGEKPGKGGRKALCVFKREERAPWTSTRSRSSQDCQNGGKRAARESRTTFRQLLCLCAEKKLGGRLQDGRGQRGLNAVNWSQHRIVPTIPHPISMGTK